MLKSVFSTSYFIAEIYFTNEHTSEIKLNEEDEENTHSKCLSVIKPKRKMKRL